MVGLAMYANRWNSGSSPKRSRSSVYIGSPSMTSPLIWSNRPSGCLAHLNIAALFNILQYLVAYISGEWLISGSADQRPPHSLIKPGRDFLQPRPDIRHQE